MIASRTISVDELSAEMGELLPSRDALSLINISNVTVVGVAIAINAATVNSSASALVSQAVSGVQY